MTVILTVIGFFAAYSGKYGRTILAYIIAFIMEKLDSDRKKHTILNIRTAFPGKTEEEIHDITHKSYRSLAITFMEIVAMPFMSLNKILSMIHFTNIELIKELNAEQKGLILLSGHFGNWELLAFSAGYLSQIPMSIIIKKQRNRHIADLLQKVRTRCGNGVIDMENAAKNIIKELLQKKPIALLADQAADPNKDVFIDFFGRPAVTYEAPAQLALKFGTPVIIGFAIRKKDGTYTVTLHRIKTEDLENNAESRVELTKRHVKILEDTIREYPEQWAWQHKRWKYEAPKQ